MVFLVREDTVVQMLRHAFELSSRAVSDVAQTYELLQVANDRLDGGRKSRSVQRYVIVRGHGSGGQYIGG
jgi:hypothetical protein